jgi:hypothetical protein
MAWMAWATSLEQHPRLYRSQQHSQIRNMSVIVLTVRPKDRLLLELYNFFSLLFVAKRQQLCIPR